MWKHQIEERRRNRTGMVLVIASCILFFAAGVSVEASGQCPANPDDIIGQIRCGETKCGHLVQHMAFIGGSCRASFMHICCPGPMPVPKEGAASQDVLLRPVHPNGQPFNYLPGPVHILDENGDIVLRGQFRRGVFKFDNGTIAKLSRSCK